MSALRISCRTIGRCIKIQMNIQAVSKQTKSCVHNTIFMHRQTVQYIQILQWWDYTTEQLNQVRGSLRGEVSIEKGAVAEEKQRNDEIK
jgi:hypothetical protein